MNTSLSYKQLSKEITWNYSFTLKKKKNRRELQTTEKDGTEPNLRQILGFIYCCASLCQNAVLAIKN